MTSLRAEPPPAFVAEVTALLGADDEARQFLASYQRPRSRGLRVNPAKVSSAELASVLGRQLSPLAWTPDGFTLVEATGGRSRSVEPTALGRHPAHLAGLFYLQEPSSMAAATALDPQPGWTVVDLAAAPGGKTTALSALVGPSGLVVANEVVGSRLRSLHDNLDRWGAANVVTTSLALDRLPVPRRSGEEVLRFDGFDRSDGSDGAGRSAGVGEFDGFDGALLDAPCSGEALWRRDPSAQRHWSPSAVAGAARRQAELLAQAASLVRPGGVLVYSTCTFNRQENEDRLVEFLAGSDQWELEDLASLGGSAGLGSAGRPTERAARWWPHREQGEGQFVARLRRRTATGASAGVSARSPGATARRRHTEDRRPTTGTQRRGRANGGHGAAARSDARRAVRDATGPPLSEVRAAWTEARARWMPGFEVDPAQLRLHHDWLFAVPVAAEALPLDALRRPGLPLGRLRPGRFEPHPALATVLRSDQVSESISWSDGQPELEAYLRGETVSHPGPDGWVLICYRRWGLGWARRSRGVLKNAFPAHLRRQAAGLPLGR